MRTELYFFEEINIASNDLGSNFINLDIRFHLSYNIDLKSVS